MPYNTVAKSLQSNSRQATKKYVPARSIWLNRVFTDLANTSERYCLIIGSSSLNKNVPGIYRKKADDLDKQVCYFIKPRDGELYNISIRTE